jgi:hypothetical protein
MKKVILISLAAISAVAFSCGDGTNRSSESETQTEDNYSNEALESDTTTMDMDTTSTPGMDREGNVDTTSVNNP